MFDYLKTMSRVFAAFAIISTVFLIPVLAYLHDYQLEFFLDKHPIIMLCILGLLMFQSISFMLLAVLTRGLAKTFFRYDLGIDKRIKDYCKKETPNP